jgi:eukaryotic-like serine/threonine-protein kinase
MEGRLILDRFRIVDELGRGGYGTVYRASDERLQRPVAVKALAGGPGGDRVLREAQAAARLNHPSIVTLYELGEDRDGVYLVSELVDGATLRELLADGALADRDVGEAGVELCHALGHAHDRGIVHRDLKPENIAISRWRDGGAGPWGRAATGRAMLMDFGVASVAGEARITRTGEVVGTLAYMAPEQAEGAHVGPAADVYSLALVLYEAWTGANPVVRATPAATARAIGSPPPPLATGRPDLPAELSDAVDSCLDPDPDLRPAALELGDRLARATPFLDASRAVPAPVGARASGLRHRGTLGRAIVLVALAGVLAALAWAAGKPGLAVVLAALALPAPIVFERPREWLAPIAASFLGLVGLAPVFPALAGLLGSPRRCAALALLGWCWLAVAEGVLGESLLFGVIASPPPGWEESAASGAESLLVPLLAPASLAPAVAWTAGAALLGALLDTRILVIRVVGALGWCAGLVAVHRMLAGGAPEPATAGLVAALAVTLAAGVWLRTTTAERPRRKRAATAMARGTA